MSPAQRCPPSAPPKCKRCGGRGYVVVWEKYFGPYDGKCPACGGTGRQRAPALGREEATDEPA